MALPADAPPKSILKPSKPAHQTDPELVNILKPNPAPGGPETGLGARQSGFRVPKGRNQDFVDATAHEG